MSQRNCDLAGFLSRCLFISNASRADAGPPLNGRYHSQRIKPHGTVLRETKKSDTLSWQCRDYVDQRVRAPASQYHTALARTADIEEILYAGVSIKIGRYSSSCPHRDLYGISRNAMAEHPNTRPTRIHNPH